MANRIANGTFEANLAGWATNYADEVLTRDTAAPIAGAASLKCVTDAADYGKGPIYSPVAPLATVEPGEALRLTYRIKGSGTIELRVFREVAADVVSAPFALPAAAEERTFDFSAGPADTFVQPAWVTPESALNAATFWLDDVVLDAAPAGGGSGGLPPWVLGLGRR